MIAVSIVFLSTSIASNGIDPLYSQEDEWQNKPLQVNIQIDVEGKHDQSYLNSILNKIESHGWITSVFVAGKFASEYPNFIQEIENRGHYIGVYGWDKENLSSLSYLQQLEIINKSISSVRRAGRIPKYIVDFKPQNLDYNDDTIGILRELGMGSITGYFDANETFVKCPYAKKVGKVTFPYPVTTEFSTVPLSDILVGDQELLIDGNLQIKSSPDNYYTYLKNEYDEHNKTREPMVFSLSPSNMNEKKLQSFSKFLDYVDKKGGKVKPTAPLTILSSYIPYLEITSAPGAACGQETINITVSFSAAISCPNYYFRIYGKYPSDKDWKLLDHPYLHKIQVGTFSFTKSFKIPTPTGDDSSYTIRVVGQACSGVCWPTPNNYERMDEVEVDIAKLCLLFVPMAGVTNFDSVVDSQLNKFISETPLQSCQETIIKKKLSQSFSGNYCGRSCGLAPLRRFASSYVKDINIYDVVIGVTNQCPDGSAGCSNRVNTIWVSNDTDSIALSHEFGHLNMFGGFDEQYCSNPAGSYFEIRCNDGGVGGIWNLWGAGGWDKNPLSGAQPYDCPPDGKTNDSTNQLCCNNPNLGKCSGYNACCYGNKANAFGGRSIMSFVGAPSPRNFDARERTILNSKDKLACPIKSGSVDMTESMDEVDSLEPETLLNIELIVYYNDSVVEYNVSLIEGEVSYYNMSGNRYNARIVGNGTILWNQSFDIYFDYSGPVKLGIDYSNITYEDFFLTFKIPYNIKMRKLEIYHNTTLIFSKNLDFWLWTLRGTVKNLSNSSIPNAYIHLIGPLSISAITNTSGNYEITGLESGDYQIYVEPTNPNLMTASEDISITSGQILEQNFTLQTAGSVAGNITDNEGGGIPNLIVYLSGYETARYRTDENGYYLIPRLQAGNYTVNVGASETGFKDNSTTVAVNLGETTITNFILTMPEGGNITGIITDANGTGIYNAQIEASGPSFKYTFSNETGYYKITGLEAGQYILLVKPPYKNNLSYYATHLTITVGKTNYLNITLEKEKSISVIEGYVFDASHARLPYVLVKLQGYYETLRLANKTDTSGYFAFKNLRSGIYELDINDYDIYPSIENYTIIEFRDENWITLVDYLQANITLLKIDVKINLNGSYFKENDTVQVNLTATNKENFDLVNLSLFLGIVSEDEFGYEQDVYLTEILTNLSALQTKSHLFTFKIPESSRVIYIESELGKKAWPVKSSEGELTASIRKAAKKEIHVGTDDDIDGDLIPNQEDNCPYHYNPNQEDVVYAYDNFNDNWLDIYHWYGVTADPGITFSEINNELRIYGTSTQENWSYLSYNIAPQRYVEASIEVKTPKLDENAVFSFALGRVGPKWGYYRIMRTKDSYRVSGELEGEEYWDSGEMYYLFGDEGTNFHTYKIIYNQLEQTASFFVDGTHLHTRRGINFENFLFSLIWEGYASGAQLDVRIDNFTVKQTGDIDNDNVGDVCDNCVYVSNPGQEDSDSDGIGNSCDNCWYSANPAQLDSNLNCPLPPYSSNPQCGDACEFVTFKIPLIQGWGLISSPLNFTNIAETFDPIKPYLVSIFAYDAKLQKFVEVDPFGQEIDLRYGMWVKVNNSVLLTITGEQFDSTYIPLSQGWNLIGHPYLTEKNVKELYANNVVYAYNNSWSSYIPNRTFNSLQTLKPGYGYWVKP